MGSTCVCPSGKPTFTPRPPGSQKTSRKMQPLTNLKYADIVPLQFDIEDSEYDLNLLNNQIAGCLDEFEKTNGVISRRLKLAESNLSSKCIGKVPQYSCISLKKQQDEVLYIDIGGKDKEINANEQLLSSSFASERGSEKSMSCMLSQQSHVLDRSIFTERLKEKEQFYAKFASFDGRKLLPWQDSDRFSYQLREQEIQNQMSNKSNLKLMVMFQAIRNYANSSDINLMAYSKNPAGLKLHLNGRKRKLPIANYTNQQFTLATIAQQINVLKQHYEVNQIAYILTGWIPEELRMNEIRSFQGIFQRLNGNLEDGNTLIFFSRKEKKSADYCTLQKIDLLNGLITINSCNNQSLIPEEFLVQPRGSKGEEVLRLQDFVMLVDVIHLSWNPTIYDYSISRECILSNKVQQTFYKLVIPPSSQDIQIRLFVEKHHQYPGYGDESSNFLTIRLFEFENMGSVEGLQPVRVITVDRRIFSDVFIFESCKEKTQYVISVSANTDSGYIAEDIYTTITLFSFGEMYFKELQSTPLLKEITVESYLSSTNMGFGINSPYFTKNIQFLIETQPNRELKVAVGAPQALQYEICLIPNPTNREMLTQLNLQSIISDSLLSHQQRGQGCFTINTSCNHYLLVINSFSQYVGDFKLNVSLYGKQKGNSPVLAVNSTKTNNNVIFFQQIKWLPTHVGPRKRLKSNSNNNFQPADVFADFFKNPCIDKELEKGKYQFFVRSETFKEYFESVDETEKNDCQPPALSMSVLEVSSDKKAYKIVIDDAYYVPFGIGFWTQEIELEGGTYRFIFPKMEKSFAVGTFGIVKC